MRPLLASCLLGSLFLLAGCPQDGAPGDAGGGTDAPVAPDAAIADAPSAIPDAPSADDAPAEIDAATADVGTADARPGFDAPRSPCDGLLAPDCLGAGCVPVWDDTCCPTCEPGGCADCTNPTYHHCAEVEASPCGTLDVCGAAPFWACNDVLPTCDGATVIDIDSCDDPGCVPSYPSGLGPPDITMATCTPIIAGSCTVSCRRVAPQCPDRTYPEGDGFCYTNRCIPAAICGR